MKKYKYRGIYFLILAVVIIICAAVIGIDSHLRGEKTVLWLVPLSNLPLMLIHFVRERRLSEKAWKNQLAQNDERNKLIMGKAAMISGGASLAAVMAGLIVLAFRETEDSAAPIILAGILVIQIFSFMIAQAVLNRKL